MLSTILKWLVAAIIIYQASSLSSSVPLTTKVSNALQYRFQDDGISRVAKCWNNFAAGIKHDVYLDVEKLIHQVADCYVDGLRAESFHDTSTYSWIANLESSYKRILQELESYESIRSKSLAHDPWLGPRDAEGSGYGPEWKTLGLQDRSVWNEDLLNQFPTTISILKQNQVPSCEVFFAKQAPNSGIKPHSDRNNFIITCHLALDVPENKCWIKVGKETYCWKNGEACIFDTSIIHSTFNEGPTTRYVLLIRFWHPELTAIEIEAFRFIFNYLDHAAMGDEAIEEFELKHVFMGKDSHKGLQTSQSPAIVSSRNIRNNIETLDTAKSKKKRKTASISPKRGFGSSVKK